MQNATETFKNIQPTNLSAPHYKRFSIQILVLIGLLIPSFSFAQYHTQNYTVTTSSTWQAGQNPFGVNSGPIKIENSLTIPNGVNLTLNMDLEFGPGAIFNILPGGSLNANSITIKSATTNSMWQGIRVDGTGSNSALLTMITSKVFDADIGILGTGPLAGIVLNYACEFNANVTSVQLSNVSGSNIYIVRSNFFQTLPLKDNLKGRLINGVAMGLNGIVIENSNYPNAPVDIGNCKNIFNGGDYGIKSVNSNVRIWNSDFLNIREVGIFADGGGLNQRRTDVTACSFVVNGIDILFQFGVSADISGNTFNATNKNALIWKYNQNCSLNIWFNTFTNVSWASVYLLDNASTTSGTGTSIIIDHNTLSCLYTYQNATGILVQETVKKKSPTYKHLAITYNSISQPGNCIELQRITGYSTDGTGIMVNGTNVNSVISMNGIAFTNSGFNNSLSAPLAKYTGLKIQDCYGLAVVDNNVDHAATIHHPNANVAVLLDNSQNTFLYRNTVKAITCVLAQRVMLNSNYYCNTLNEKDYGRGFFLIKHVLRANGGFHGKIQQNPLAVIARENTFIHQSSNNPCTDIDVYCSNINLNKWIFSSVPRIAYTYGTSCYNLPRGSIRVPLNGINDCASPNMQIPVAPNQTEIPAGSSSFELWQTEYVKETYFRQGLVTIGTSNNFIVNLIDLETALSDGDFANASTLLNNLMPSGNIEINIKNTYSVLLSSKYPTYRELTPEEVTYLTSIASADPSDEGPAVYAARIILRNENNSQFTDPVLNLPNQYISGNIIFENCVNQPPSYQHVFLVDEFDNDVDTAETDTNGWYIFDAYKLSLLNQSAQYRIKYINPEAITQFSPPGTILLLSQQLNNLTYTCNEESIIFSGIEEKHKTAVRIYPNPASHSLNIEKGSLKGNITLSIQNLLGQEILNTNLLDSESKIDISKIDKGVYIVKLSDKHGKKHIQHIIIE